MKSLHGLLMSLLADCENKTETDLSLDAKCIKNRVEHEGLSFLTITLPDYCDAFHNALANGRIDPGSFPSFRRKRGTSLPRFLSGLTSLVFDAEDGTLLHEPSIDAIASIRQICLACKKISLDCSKEREAAAFDNYVRVDLEVSNHTFSSEIIADFTAVCDWVWPRVLMSVERKAYEKALLPRHSGGATADRISANRKYRFGTWHTRLDLAFPGDQYVLPNVGFSSELAKLDFLEPDKETPVRVVSVPKTLKGPRIIAMEPVCMAYAQQALLHEIVRSIEDSKYASCIRFTDQSVNGALALSSSRSRSHATLDLKDASDRVSLQLAELLFSRLPNLWEAAEACRSRTAALPDGRTIRLAKWASMGSALCFPVLAMTAYVAIVMAVRQRKACSIERACCLVNKSAAIYGDDIIVPVDWSRDVILTLEAVGLRVNVAKSFSTGKFRESCGVDAYDGYDVTPTRVRRLLPRNINCVQEIESAVSLSNLFYRKGYWLTADFIKRHVEKITGRLPLASVASPGYLAWENFQSVEEFSSYCPRLHRRSIKAYVVESEKRRSPLSGMGALLKFFLIENREKLDKDHLLYAGRPVSRRLKKRWVGTR